MENRKFDLNIEEILEDWEIYHGIREIIANAIDEQVLTNTKEIEIKKIRNNLWSIRDYGRGLKYEHLTQKEDEEKLNNPLVIGKFGIGLKDALATFNRKNVNVKIITKHGDIKLIKSTKYGFEDITTLHAEILPPSDIHFIGTEFRLSNAKDSDIEKAKKLFLKFSDEKIIESTQYGDIINKKGIKSNIYVKGVKVAEEEEFEKHQAVSRASAGKKFGSGLADMSEQTVRLHTATHLLNEALRKVLRKEIVQKGSNITPERLRFDFNFDRKLNDDELRAVEEVVNEQIRKALPVERIETSLEEAKEMGTQAVFEQKYDDRVSVYSIGDFSLEICSGPHVENLRELGTFRIIKEEGISSSVRRIRAVLEV